jgi:Uncharacterized protein conserved in bacteria
MGWYLDGRATVVVGTHTHVATADEHVLPGGTAYITDVGMTGPHDGVIGMDRAGIVKKFLDGLPARFEVATGDVQMNAVLIETDDTGPRGEAGRLRAKSIERLRLRALLDGRSAPVESRNCARRTSGPTALGELAA